MSTPEGNVFKGYKITTTHRYDLYFKAALGVRPLLDVFGELSSYSVLKVQPPVGVSVAVNQVQIVVQGHIFSQFQILFK